jgi:carbonic anhydrase/acetyltransferase-like protein (isoleucine patch superfamily)
VVQSEGGTFVGLYHATSVNSTGPTDIYRATTTNLTGNAWTMLDNGLPFIARAASYEVDQIADVNVGTAPNGVQIIAWDSYDNGANGISSITMAALSPVLKRFDGVAWRQAIAQSRSMPLLGEASNEAWGMGALTYNQPNPGASTGIGNVAFGTRALGANTSGSQNAALGTNALLVATTANNNTAIGYFAAKNTTTGTGNTVLGSSAFQSNTTGNNNTAVGYQALSTNTASNNTAVGQGALVHNTTGTSNTAVGMDAFAANTTGGGGTAVGQNALAASQASANNTAVGNNSMVVLNGGNNNTAIGQGSMNSATTAGSNVAAGINSLFGLTTGNNNIGVGPNGGRAFTTGSHNTAIGDAAGYTDGTTATGATIGNATLIGENAQSQISNVIVLGKTITTRPNLYFGAAPTADLTGGGVGVFHIANVVTPPASSPSGGGVLYVSAGALVYKGSSGTVTTLGPA